MLLRMFPSLLEHPQNIRFAEQENHETIELFLRNHWATNIPWIFGSILAFILPSIVLSVDTGLNLNILKDVPLEVLLASVAVWYLLILAYIIERFLYWYFNVYIVTNMHIVDINFHSLLSRDIVEVNLKDIQSQSSKMQGLGASMFRYGDVHIETAAERQNIDFLAVPEPDRVADLIQDLRTKAHKKEKTDDQ